MATDKIKAAEAVATWELWCQVPSMFKAGLITEEQRDALKSQLNDKLHAELDITGE